MIGVRFTTDATRTCSIFVGVGDQTNRFVAVGYSHETVNIYDNIDSPTWNGHPKLPDLVYIDKHVQPSSDPCMGSLMQKYYGTLDAEVAIRQVAAVFQTGDMHVAVYDYTKNFMYVSNASPANATGGGVIPAYDRPYVRLDMASLFAEPHP
jgi:isopenicillin-N N-acyltransferase like protein